MNEVLISEVKDYLEAVYEMSLSEDWDESSAQELIMDGASLWEKINEEDC